MSLHHTEPSHSDSHPASHPASRPASTSPVPRVDVRGPRTVAWVTTAVLAVVLLLAGASAVAAAVLLGIQAVVFAVGAIRGPAGHPYGVVHRALVAPRLGPVSETEPVPPLKFAQAVGFVFALVGTVGFAVAVPALGYVATGFALIAAILNAAFGLCLGCKLYPLASRILPARTTAVPS
ncbi:DUF4395 domain-containing protein [Rhodococcoides corynebacterioides]|uniref:DUF4395 domain-containing protein n=1 Tax=Rhodococcoides corynebacterioides TaxID=53972 RepID=UPI001C9AC51C|nr:DUF4395 domain-containing protein [Rhodococcus corynebacterioides]MBY6348834.1 DUF4395 domain-containing protein [Rhodococcus corynebacterioides]